MTQVAFVLSPVVAADFEAMLALRDAAMRESLERVGRYTPERSRARLLTQFVPAHMHHLIAPGGERMGFFTVLPVRRGVLRLEHLFLLPVWQCKGIGAAVLAQVQARARAENALLQLSALQGSHANRFYLRHGFVPTGEEGVEIHYEWRAAGGQS